MNIEWAFGLYLQFVLYFIYFFSFSVEADKNLVKVIQSRGFPVNKINEENKPSNLMRSVEMGVQEVGDYVSEAIEE